MIDSHFRWLVKVGMYHNHSSLFIVVQCGGIQPQIWGNCSQTSRSSWLWCKWRTVCCTLHLFQQIIASEEWNVQQRMSVASHWNNMAVKYTAEKNTLIRNTTHETDLLYCNLCTVSEVNPWTMETYVCRTLRNTTVISTLYIL